MQMEIWKIQIIYITHKEFISLKSALLLQMNEEKSNTLME